MLKKILILLLAAAMLAAAASCAGGDPEKNTASAGKTPETATTATTEETAENSGRLFDFDVSEYVKIPDARAFTLKKEDVESAAEGYAADLAKNNPVKKQKTEGTVEENDITYIYYKGTLIIFDDDVTLTYGSCGIPALDEQMALTPPSEGRAYELKLPDDFAFPPFITRESDLLEKELAGKTVTIVTSAVPESLPAAGEELSLHLRFEYAFSGGTYDETTGGGTGYELTIGSHRFITGFEDGMIGMDAAPGSARTLSLAFPNPYSNNPALAGEKVEFAVTIVSVTGLHVCDLGDPDGFAAFKENYTQAYGADSFDYTDKAALMVDYTRRAKANLCYDLINNGIEVIKENETLLEEYKDKFRQRIVQEYGQYYYQSIGRMMSESEVIYYFFNDDAEYFDESISETATTYLHEQLTYFGVYRALGLEEITEEQVDEYLAEQTAYYIGLGYTGLTAQDVLDVLFYGDRSEVTRTLTVNKLLDWMADNVPVTE